MKCKKCNQANALVSGVVRGVYVTGYCRPCFNMESSRQSVSSGHAEYNRQRDFENMQADIAQPRTQDGKPSTDFIRLYPQQASKIFSESEIRNYG